MENIKKKQTGIDILAEMTRRDMERSLQIKDTDNVTVEHPTGGGVRLMKRDNDPLIQHKVWQAAKAWQDDYK
jgi:hypothetical protein